LKAPLFPISRVTYIGVRTDYLDCGAGEDNGYMADPADTVLANCQRNIGPK